MSPCHHVRYEVHDEFEANTTHANRHMKIENCSSSGNLIVIYLLCLRYASDIYMPTAESLDR